MTTQPSAANAASVDKGKGLAGLSTDALTGKIEDLWESFSKVKYGRKDPASRALTFGSQFTLGTMAINAAQFLGAPLALINEEWHNDWIKFNKQQWGLLITTMTHWWSPTLVRVSGDKSVRGQLSQSADGQLACNFAERMVLIANHQIYTDWLYLWYVGYANGLHGQIHVVMKESLRKLPFVGWGMTLSKFIFLKRNWEQDKAGLAKHLQSLNKPDEPMWLMFFPEGTNLAPDTREKSKSWADKNGIKDMQHVLLPRSTGLQFSLLNLRGTVDYVYDCTIAYEGVRRGEFAQDIFTLQTAWVSGHPPKSVNMHWRRFKISSIPLDDLKTFDLWLRARWTEKDALMEHYMRTGRFPADTGFDNLGEGGQIRQGAGHIETQVKPNNWYEILQVFAPIATIAIVLYYFYNKAIPTQFLDKATDWAGYSEDDIKKLLRVGPAPKLGKPKTISSQALRNTLEPPKLQEVKVPSLVPPIAPPSTRRSSIIASATHSKSAAIRAGSIAGMSSTPLSTPKPPISITPPQESASKPNVPKPSLTRAPIQNLASTSKSVQSNPTKKVPKPTALSSNPPATRGSTSMPTEPKASNKQTAAAETPATKVTSNNAVEKAAATNVPTTKPKSDTSPQKTAATKAPATEPKPKPNGPLKKTAATEPKPKAPLEKASGTTIPDTKVNSKAAMPATQKKNLPVTKLKPKASPEKAPGAPVPDTKANSKAATPPAQKKDPPAKKPLDQATPPKGPEKTKPAQKPLAKTAYPDKPQINATETKPLATKLHPTPTAKAPAHKEPLKKTPVPKIRQKRLTVPVEQGAWSDTTAVDDPWSERPSGKRLIKSQPTRKDRVKVAKKEQRHHLDHIST